MVGIQISHVMWKLDMKLATVGGYSIKSSLCLYISKFWSYLRALFNSFYTTINNSRLLGSARESTDVDRFRIVARKYHTSEKKKKSTYEDLKVAFSVPVPGGPPLQPHQAEDNHTVAERLHVLPDRGTVTVPISRCEYLSSCRGRFPEKKSFFFFWSLKNDLQKFQHCPKTPCLRLLSGEKLLLG